MKQELAASAGGDISKEISEINDYSRPVTPAPTPMPGETLVSPTVPVINPVILDDDELQEAANKFADTAAEKSQDIVSDPNVKKSFLEKLADRFAGEEQ